MIVTVTSIKLKSLLKFFQLSLFALRITRQLQKHKGLVKFKKRGLGLNHYTITVWENEEDMKAFAYSSGAHKESMKSAAGFASEIASYTYQSENIPDWKEAVRLLKEKGRVVKYDK